MTPNEERECIEAQRKYCEEHEVPCYIPLNGQCPNCFRDIFGKTAYNLIYAKTQFITGCPNCGRSFCD